MTELWELNGEHWKVPIEVTWTDTLASVVIGAGMSLPNRAYRAALEILDPISTFANDKVFIYKPDLCAVAVKSIFTDPEDIFYWAPQWKPVAVRTDFECPDTFVSGYCQSQYAIIRDTVTFDAIWLSLCKYLLHRLVNERAEVNFGFAKIVPLTLRKNWISILARWEHDQRRRRKIFEKDLLNPDEESMINRGIADRLCSSDVIAWDESSDCFRDTLEIIPEAPFHEMVARREKELVKRGRWKLVAIADVLRHQLARALSVYADHIKESVRPHVRIRERVLDGRTGKWSWTVPSEKVVRAQSPWSANSTPPSPSDAPDAEMETGPKT